MTSETRPGGQGENAADEKTGSGPGAERGGRDAGMPGPAQGTGTGGEGANPADPTRTDTTGRRSGSRS